jgi:hypothetical protein
MNTRVVSVTAVLLTCGAAGVWVRAAPAGTGTPPPAPMPNEVVLTAASMSMDDAVRMAEQRYHARVVRAETESDHGHTVYVLRLLNDAGRVWTVRVDAASGTVL